MCLQRHHAVCSVILKGGEKFEGTNIYDTIAQRTQGDIYIGLVGLCTGKSTFIKRFMDTLVLPNIDSEYLKERSTDELPQSAQAHHNDHRA